jgi:hypothetical protein
MDTLRTLRLPVRQGKIELLDAAELPEASVLVTLLPDDETEFWLSTCYSGSIPRDRSWAANRSALVSACSALVSACSAWAWACSA